MRFAVGAARAASATRASTASDKREPANDFAAPNVSSQSPRFPGKRRRALRAHAPR